MTETPQIIRSTGGQPAISGTEHHQSSAAIDKCLMTARIPLDWIPNEQTSLRICPLEHSAVMEMFYTSVFGSCSHKLCGTTQHWEQGWCDQGTVF